jgi:hypothetical protein
LGVLIAEQTKEARNEIAFFPRRVQSPHLAGEISQKKKETYQKFKLRLARAVKLLGWTIPMHFSVVCTYVHFRTREGRQIEWQYWKSLLVI